MTGAKSESLCLLFICRCKLSFLEKSFDKQDRANSCQLIQSLVQTDKICIMFHIYIGFKHHNSIVLPPPPPPQFYCSPSSSSSSPILLGNLSTRRFLRGDGNRKSNLLPIHVSRRQGPPSGLRADFVLLILTSPVKREFRYYDFRAFISFCLQYFAHSDT